jgi:hypothetical protein
MMQDDFTITGTPTGFQDGEVTLTGYFEYDWDAVGEKLIVHKIITIMLDRTEFADTTGITYKFSAQTIDRSQLKQSEGNYPEGRGYRDTLHLIASILSTHTIPGQGNRTETLCTKEFTRMGNRYYEPHGV